MSEGIGPISDFIAELKTKMPMSPTEEIELTETLKFEARYIKAGKVQDFVNEIRRQMDESRTNQSVEKVLDFTEIRKIAKKSKEIVNEIKANNNDDVRANVTTGEQKIDIIEEGTSQSKNNITPEFEAAIDDFVSKSFPGLSPMARTDMKKRIENGSQIKQEYAQECKDAGGKISVRGFLERISKKRGVSVESLELDSTLELGAKIEHNQPQNFQEFVDTVVSDPIVSDLYSENIEELKSVLENCGPNINADQAYIEMQKIAGGEPQPSGKKGMSWLDFYNERFVIPSLEKVIRQQTYKLDIKIQEELNNCSGLDFSQLSEILKKQQRLAKELNNNRMAYASLNGQENPIISEELRKAIIEEYMNGDQPVAKVFEKFKNEGRLIDKRTTALDFIDVVAQELANKNMSEETCEKFIANETEIAEELCEIEACKILRDNSEKSGMLADEYNKNLGNIRTILSKIENQNMYSSRYRDLLKSKQNDKGQENKRIISGVNLKRIFHRNRFKNIGLSSPIKTNHGIVFNDELTEQQSSKFSLKNMFSALRKSRVTTLEANNEKHDLAPLAKDQNKEVGVADKSNNSLKPEDIHIGDQQQTSSKDDDRDI